MGWKKITSEVRVCDICGEVFSCPIIIDGKEYCTNCYNHEFVECDVCGHEKHKSLMIPDDYVFDRLVCKECIKEKYEYYKEIVEGKKW